MIKKSKTPTTVAQRCQQLTTEIKKHASGAREETDRAARVRHVVACGRALSKLKKMLEHGRWARWLEERCSLNRMTANRYIRLASRANKLDRNMTIREAYIAAGVITPKD